MPCPLEVSEINAQCWKTIVVESLIEDAKLKIHQNIKVLDMYTIQEYNIIQRYTTKAKQNTIVGQVVCRRVGQKSTTTFLKVLGPIAKRLLQGHFFGPHRLQNHLESELLNVQKFCDIRQMVAQLWSTTGGIHWGTRVSPSWSKYKN